MTAPFSECPLDRLLRVRRLYFDVDDTLTTRGALFPDAVEALYEAHEAGFSLVAVTGRSAAWGEMLLRILPLDAVVAETGAMCFYRRTRGGVGTVHSEPDATVRKANAQRRASVVDTVLSQVASARLAVDNIGRVYDVAFDLVEDGKPVSESDAARIRTILESEGLTVAQSSVHINAWFGSFDKATMVNRYLLDIEGVSLNAASHSVLYIGDSRNDAEMFNRAGVSVGVANVQLVLDALDKVGMAPDFITDGEMGAGFCEVADRLIGTRGE